MPLKRCGSIALTAGVLSLAAFPASAVIINGLAGSGATLSWDGVGVITDAFGSFSGVLIDSTHVLTAAHTIYNVGAHATVPASSITFNVGSGAVTASKVVIPTGYVGGNPTVSGNTTDYSVNDRYDLAVITLSSPMLNTTAYGYNTGSIVETAAGNATIVGYGVGGSGSGGEDPGNYPFGTKRAGLNSIDLVTTNPTGTTLTDGGGNRAILPTGAIVWDFDAYSSTSPTSGPLGGQAVGPTEGDASNGDSGGPIFQTDPITHQPIITGIINDGTNNTSFGEITWATQTAAYASFIAANTPEPSSLAVLWLGGTTLLARRKRRA